MEIKNQLHIAEGWILHSRLKSPSSDVNNSFRYNIFNLLVPIHEKSELAQLHRSLLLSLNPIDYIDKSDRPFSEKIFDFLSTEANYTCDQIWLQTLPRLFGYAFNPVNFWYCYKNGILDAVLCEVNNTFGDRHFYFIQNPLKKTKIEKRFHVSPFFDVDGAYTFEFEVTQTIIDVKINLHQNQELKLITRLHLQTHPYLDISDLLILRKYGWMTAMVIFRIHFQALKLWLKGARFFRRPPPPQEKVTGETRYDLSKVR